MDTWVWLVIVAVVVVTLFALAWRASRRAKPRGREPDNSLTPEQVERINLLALRNRAGQMGPFA